MSYRCIEFQDVSYAYGNMPGGAAALDGVTFHVDSGEFIAVVGASGSGKSTLAMHCNGVLVPSAGKVWINGRDTASRKERAGLWQQAGLVMQYPEQQLFEATVFDDVAYGPKNLGLAPREVERAVENALELVGLDAGQVGGLSPFALSGGEKRRVAIAGSIALSPSILVLDEPLAGLDPPGRKELIRQLSALNRRQGMTVMLVTHNMDDVAGIAGRVIVMSRGTIRTEGSVRDVFYRLGPELEAEGVEVPFAVKILHRLREAGYPVQEAYTTGGAAREIIKACRSRGGNGV